MHGVINRALQNFLTDTFGAAAWARIVARAQLPDPDFEAMLVYDPALADHVLQAASAELNRDRDQILEDLGTYLVTHPRLAPVRRLLRFGGASYAEFLHSLNGLGGRLRLALPDFDAPQLRVRRAARNRFYLTCHWGHPGMGHVLIGVLRGMADDYGALVVLQHRGGEDRDETLLIDVVDSDFTDARGFDLAEAGV